MNIEQCINDKTHILCILQIHKIILNRYTMPLASIYAIMFQKYHYHLNDYIYKQ
jgi:hypothetical protein